MNTNKIGKRELEKGLKKSGFRLTGTRKTILDIVSNAKNELSAEEVFIIARKKNPKIGIATIYRTLGLLKDFRIVKRYHSGDKRTKYSLINRLLISETDEFFKNHSGNKSTKKGIQNKKIIDNQNILTGFNEVALVSGSTVTNYPDFSEIDKIQNQLDKWLLELNKIKKEKEIKLEEMMNDFGSIDKVLRQHDNSKSDLIQVLLDIQDEYNWLPKHVLLYVGNRLNISLTQIYSIASFYKFFNLEPKGKYQITVCAGTACHVRGSMNLLQRIVNIIKINPGDTTADYKFTLDTVNCLGCCALGPVMYFNNKYFSDPSTKELKKLFNTV
jgi:NADH-quinone oxidoreductase subunit E